ncbi:MAG: GNAT family N-acetyltransferase, partial [Candidatus Obscuribacterales bacterium]|nr:GNAT family N-acetyltransferase [Candidatus Obscuribacterales bacterium]
MGNQVVHEKLRNGKELIIRAINANDKDNMKELMRHLSPESRYFRFFTPKDTLTDKELKAFTEIDLVKHVGILASILENGTQIPAGSARYIICEKKDNDLLSAELSFAVEEEYQGQGIGSLLFKHLLEIAIANKIEQFIAYVLSNNKKMLRVFEKCGVPMKKTLGEQGV